MSERTDQDELMIRYLLGELPEEEQQRLEQEYFADEELYQQVVALEDELRYEYAQGGLTPQQRRDFEKRFLVSAEDRQKVALSGAILSKVFEVSRQRAAARRWEWLTKWFTPRTPAMGFALAAAALGIVAVGGWFMLQTLQLRERMERLEAQRRSEGEKARQELAQERNRSAELERQLAGRQGSAAAPALLSFILTPGLVRDADMSKPLVIPAGESTVRLQLDVKAKGQAYPRYRVELQTVEGKRIWSKDVKQPVLNVPARLLGADDYVVELKGITAQGETEEAGEYYFAVVRR